MAPDTPLAAALERWLTVSCAVRQLPRTYGITRARVRVHLLPGLGADRPINAITKLEVANYAARIRSKGLAVSTQRKILADAIAFFRWLADNEILPAAPIPRRLKPPDDSDAREPDYLTDDEIAILRDLPDPYGFAIRFGLASGLRWEELIRAQAAHLDRGELVVEETKTRHTRRVPLPPAILRELRERVGRLVPFTPAASASFAASVRRRSGITRFHVRQLRTTFARLEVRAGISPWVLQRLLGHRSIQTTMKYVAADMDLIRREMHRVWSQQP